MARKLLVAALLCATAVSGAACGQDERDVPAAPSPAKWRPWTAIDVRRLPVPAPPRPGTAAARASERATAALRTRRDDPVVRESVARWTASPSVGPWQEVAMRFVSLRAKDPPAGSRAYALVGIASYDAVVAAARLAERHGREGWPSAPAAIAGASSRVLAHAFPEHPRAGLDAMALEAAEAQVVSGRADRASADAGLALGRAIAERAIARVARDEVQDPPVVPLPQEDGAWRPPPGSTARPTQPRAGEWTTWLLADGRAVRPPGPPPYRSAEFRAEAQRVIDVDAALTPEQRRIARFWEGGEGTELPPGIWVRATLAVLRARQVDDARASRAVALVTAAMSDAGVAAWDAKYAFWTTRPVNAIRDLGLDRDWEPLLDTPLFPAYPSGHATYSGAAAEVLAHLFPKERAVWRRRAQEAADSRVFGGIHYEMDGSVGLRMGRAIGRLAVERAERDGAET